MVLSFSAMGQIAPYQIVNDVDGEHRILMTNSDGEYIRVGLLDAVIDSIGIQLEQVGDSICIVGGNCIFNPTGGSQLTEAQVDAYADNNGYLEVEIDGSITNEIQDISLSGSDLSISSGSTIDLSSIDTDTNTQLTESQVDAYADNNGYLETEVDGSITNELQTIIKFGNTVTLSNSGGSFTDSDTQLTEVQVDAFADNNGYLETEVDGSITNEIQDISLSGSDLTISSGSTIDLSSIDTDTNTQLTEAQVDAYADNNGYLETEVDGSITNEIQTLTDNGATFSLSNSGGTVTKTVDTNTQLTEAQVDAFADNNGYNEVIGTDSDINTSGSYVVDLMYMTDGVVTSHSTRQLFQLESEDDRDLAPEDIVYSEDFKTYFTSKNGLDTGTTPNSDYQDAIVFNTWIDGSGGDANLLSFDKSEKKIYHYQADQAATNWGTPEVLAYVSDIPTDTNTQLTEAQVDAYADNNGYLETEVDGSITNEIQTLSKSGSTVTLSDGGGSFTDEVDDNDSDSYNEGEITFENIATANEVGVRSNTNYSKLLTLKGEDGITIDHSTNKFTFGLDATAVNDADSDPTNEIQDTSEIVGLLEFVQNNSTGGAGGKFIDGTDALDAAYLAGDVGVGTMTPQATLDVSGTLYVDDDAEFNGPVLLNDDLSSNGNFYVDGTSSFNDDAQFDGDMTSTATIYGDIIKVSDRVGGAAVKGAFFDANNQLIEGTIITDTNTQLTNAEVETIIATNTAGFITVDNDTQDLSISGQVLSLTDGGSVTLPDANTQLSQSDIEAMGFSTTDLVNDNDSDPTNEIQDTTQIVGLLEFVQNNSTGGAGGKFVDGTTATEAVYTDGFVGIGTTDPDALLHVKSTGNGEIEIERNAGAKINIQAQSARGVIGTDTNHELDLKTNATTRVRILSNGNVGINETAPTQSLSVNGAFSGEFPKASGLNNVVMGVSNAGSMTSGVENFIVGQGNLTLATSINRSTVSGQDNARGVSTSSYNSFFGYGNMYANTGGTSYNFMSGYRNLFYSVGAATDNVMIGRGNGFNATAATSNATLLGRENGYNASSVNTSTMIGWRNCYSNTNAVTQNNIIGYGNMYHVDAAIVYNSVMGYHNAYNATDVDYSSLFGFKNAYNAGNLDYTSLFGRDNGYSSSSVIYTIMSGYANAMNASSTITDSALFGRSNAMDGFDIQYSIMSGLGNAKAAQYIRNSSIFGRENAYVAGQVQNSFMSGYRNAYTTTNNVNYSMLVGYQNGYSATVALNNTILLGYRQGYSIGSKGAESNRLAIGMIADTPLIYGEFDNKVVEIDGNLTVTDRAGAPDKGAAFDTAGKLVESDLFIAGYGGLERNSIDGVVSTVAAVEVDFNVNFGSTNTTVSTTDESITVTKGGYWKVTIDGEIERYIAYDEFKVQVRNNGNGEHTFETHAGADDFSFNFSAVLDLDDGDEITILLDSDLDNDYDYKRIQFTLHRIANN